jgi:hypothetical protein
MENELEIKRKQKFWKENEDDIIQLLYFIHNIQNLKYEYHNLDTIQDMQKFKKIIDEFIYDEYLVLTNYLPSEEGNYLTIIRVENKENLYLQIPQLVSDVLGEFKFFIEFKTYPKMIGFINEEGKKLFLYNYNQGVITV